ncbi:Cytosine-specific methyltransferase [Streptomyces ambofaciens ATCC 23877]|uniref:Cytosine-specific methyltransferase n=1 Tax=Streptomyces ambofaciens (strain ATCC 23877 / 3486 / DSM 40053 / JCM 4204 / NBRC 12836 / NRRL B-2516) TaxID=278992 RepID=A0A0K2B272_STRA7|nr:DNA (cytosine-5-)-methyltransferase [Streptomyces ambofaciens]AKZ59187.1 Cytosine-specific methyltransferase [Streptomyces ambofaciens ATCC 23877]WNA15380.1 DNA methyltransferase [Streptomyces phage Samy]
MSEPETSQPKILELCAGYGGIGLAVEPLIDGQVTHVAEVTKHACKILEDRFPGAENIGDVTKYDWSALVGRIDVITAGFPCQDISNAGRREGINGKRSGIWKQVAEAVGTLRPKYVFLENVAVLRTRGLDVVAQDLAEVGYDLRWTTLRASDIGAAHHRSRWFGFATPAVSHPEGI